jgi:hypothetical protein
MTIGSTEVDRSKPFEFNVVVPPCVLVVVLVDSRGTSMALELDVVAMEM